MEKKKRTTGQVVVCVGLLVLIWGGYFLVKEYIIGRRLEVKADDFSWVYQVDAAETRDGEFVLKGFAFELDKNAVGDNYEIVLQELETGKNYFLAMDYLERKDVNDYFLCEYDYLQSGFEARIKEKKLNLQERDYEVLLRMAGEKKAYRTGTYLTEGQLVYTNPTEFVPLEVAGTELEEVVENGVLRVYRPDYGMYVYQYDGELYWIAEPGYGFVDEDTYVQYQLYTTQIANLPEVRLKNEWYWDNIGFQFTTNELKGQNFGIYRVAKKALPVEYAITRIWTGNHIDEWIWRQNFRPWYVFEK